LETRCRRLSPMVKRNLPKDPLALSALRSQFPALQPVDAAGVEAELVGRMGIPWREIFAAAEELDTEIIVIGSPGKHGLKTLVLGNTVENITRHAPWYRAQTVTLVLLVVAAGIVLWAALTGRMAAGQPLISVSEAILLLVVGVVAGLLGGLIGTGWVQRDAPHHSLLDGFPVSSGDGDGPLRCPPLARGHGATWSGATWTDGPWVIWAAGDSSVFSWVPGFLPERNTGLHSGDRACLPQQLHRADGRAEGDEGRRRHLFAGRVPDPVVGRNHMTGRGSPRCQGFVATQAIAVTGSRRMIDVGI
jgi:hypothetical protein